MFHEELMSKNTDITYNIFLKNFSFFRLNISPSHYFLPILFLCLHSLPKKSEINKVQGTSTKITDILDYLLQRVAKFQGWKKMNSSCPPKWMISSEPWDMGRPVKCVLNCTDIHSQVWAHFPASLGQWKCGNPIPSYYSICQTIFQKWK